MTEVTKPNRFLKAGMAALLLIVIFIAGLEYYYRSKGFQLSYNDDKMFWASERRKIYEPAGQLTVFIGSSRGKWDIDIDTWEMLTGEKAVQLAIVGSSPRKILFDLANDEKFTGKLVVDIMEPLVFFKDTMMTERFVNEALGYYHDETPAQRASTELGLALESKLVLLEEGKFGLNETLLELSQENNRPGVRPNPIPFRKEYMISTSRRQMKFTPVFLNNPELVKIHEEHWKKDMMGGGRPGPPPVVKGGSFDSLCLEYKMAFDKIRARGGSVVLLRLPSTGFHLEAEKRLLPRSEYWDRFVQNTNTPGIHYADYPATAEMICTEGSHLNPDDAVKYTTSLVSTLKTEMGWTFNLKH